jgi:ankyrin repeat protein
MEQPFVDHLAGMAAGASIATICLTYLSGLDPDLPLQDLRTQSAFSTYCAEYWTEHARAVQRTHEALQSQIIEFLGNETACSVLYGLDDHERPWKKHESRRKVDARPLYLASTQNLEETVRELLNQGANVNARGGLYNNALQAASCGGHGSIVRLLLDRGADVNAEGGHYGNALQAALAVMECEIVQMLLDAGADVNAQGGHYGTVLQAAATGCRVKILRLLLDRGACHRLTSARSDMRKSR